MSKVRYVWLNFVTGKFSNSWSEKEHKHISMSSTQLNDYQIDGYRLIKYECPYDEDFQFTNRMSLQLQLKSLKESNYE